MHVSNIVGHKIRQRYDQFTLAAILYRVVDRVSERAKANAHAIENKSYGRDELLADLAWFWDQAAKDAAAAAQYIRDKSQGT